MIKFSEYVSLGHPDKIADYISQYLLDRYIERDPTTRYAVEVQIKGNNVTLGGEVSSAINFCDSEISTFVRKAVNQIGYNAEYQKIWGRGNTICGDDLDVTSYISQQSPDIAQGLDGWGDQGIFFGYAEPSPGYGYMPKDHALAKRLCKELFESGIGGLDIKTQVYCEDDYVTKVIVAIPLLDEEHWRKEKVRHIIDNIILSPCPIIINGTGRYVQHSSVADCGTTGRKLVVDFYGGNCKIGGGSPWTKDGSKADLTLNIHARALARSWAIETDRPIIVSLACCIGKVAVDTVIQDAKTGEVISKYEQKLLPNDLIQQYGLNEPIFADMCRWGLFGEYQGNKLWETNP